MKSKNLFFSRRNFLKSTFKTSFLLYLLSNFPFTSNLLFRKKLHAKTKVPEFIDNKHIFVLKEAKYYKKLDMKKIECELCPHRCRIGDVERGMCGVRENRDGVYYTLVYANPCAVHVDPIEKKPLFHFLPATLSFSIATAGCNMACKFCQNWDISQSRPEQTQNAFLPPEKVVEFAKRNNCHSIAYTYSEPTVFTEYVLDCGIEGRKQGVKSVTISNGYINEKPLRDLCKYALDAVKIDFKAYTEKFYKDICLAKLKPVIKTLEVLKDIGIWFELVYLIIPTLNDKLKDIQKMSKWISSQLSSDIPLHFTRFHPTYILKNLPPTPISTIEKARSVALNEGMKYVYVGNVPGHEGENTYCHSCKKTLIRRFGFSVLENNISKGKCKFCGSKIPGVWV